MSVREQFRRLEHTQPAISRVPTSQAVAPGETAPVSLGAEVRQTQLPLPHAKPHAHRRPLGLALQEGLLLLLQAGLWGLQTEDRGQGRGCASGPRGRWAASPGMAGRAVAGADLTGEQGPELRREGPPQLPASPPFPGLTQQAQTGAWCGASAWDHVDHTGSPELLDLAAGALQALEQQPHPGIAQLIGAKAQLRQRGVGLEGRADILAPHLREAAVIQPVDRTRSHSKQEVLTCQGPENSKRWVPIRTLKNEAKQRSAWLAVREACDSTSGW